VESILKFCGGARSVTGDSRECASGQRESARDSKSLAVLQMGQKSNCLFQDVWPSKSSLRIVGLHGWLGQMLSL